VDGQCVGEMVICVHEAQHAAQIHCSVTTYSVQNSISDTLRLSSFSSMVPIKPAASAGDACLRLYTVCAFVTQNKKDLFKFILT
jgi:hypothetical protein